MTNMTGSYYPFVPDDRSFCSRCSKPIREGLRAWKFRGKVVCLSCTNIPIETAANSAGTCSNCATFRFVPGDLVGYLPDKIWCFYCLKGRDPELAKLSPEKRAQFNAIDKRLSELEKLPGRSPEREEELQSLLKVLKGEFCHLKAARKILRRFD